MDPEKLGRSRFLNVLFRPAGRIMESRLRAWLFDPVKSLKGAGLEAGQSVLEVGCGTGFFTLPAARMIGEEGRLVALEPFAGFAERTRSKVTAARLGNVEVLTRDALKSGLDDAEFDVALLFGVLPYPTLPLGWLLPEMHRLLKPGGSLAVWMFPVSFGVPSAIERSGLFSTLGKRNGVYRYARTDGATGE